MLSKLKLCDNKLKLRNNQTVRNICMWMQQYDINIVVQKKLFSHFIPSKYARHSGQVSACIAGYCLNFSFVSFDRQLNHLRFCSVQFHSYLRHITRMRSPACHVYLIKTITFFKKHATYYVLYMIILTCNL